jgi:hypothetical protein
VCIENERVSPPIIERVMVSRNEKRIFMDYCCCCDMRASEMNIIQNLRISKSLMGEKESGENVKASLRLKLARLYLPLKIT